MARKRGGLAGLYDRNKGVIKALAPIALGAIPGVGMPLAVAAGAAMGADKEGKGYFKNFDVGGALKGGVAGYGQGATGAGVRGLLTGAAKSGVTAGQGFKQAMQEYNRPASNMLGRLTGGGNAATAQASPMLQQNAVGQTGGFFPGAGGAGVNPLTVAGKTTIKKAPSFLAKAGTFAKENKDLLTMAGKGVQSVLPNPESDAALMNAETARMRLDEERRQMQLEDERRRRIAELLMPMFRQQFPQYAGS
jgi:hypothetical protein